MLLMYVAKLFNLISPWRWSCRCQPWPPPHQPATCAAWSSRGHGPCGDERSRADSFLDGPSYAGLRHRQTETCENTLVNHGSPHCSLISALRIRSKNALCAIGWELHEPCTWRELKSMRWSRTLYKRNIATGACFKKFQRLVYSSWNLWWELNICKTRLIIIY